MGSSYWSDDFYKDRQAERAKKGVDAFAYHAVVAKSAPRDRKVHEKLNPFGVKIRESRDSKEHPDSLAIGVMLDVTGSMSNVPRVVQKQLPKLMGLLTRTGYVKDPQILFGAVGDARSDHGSLQVGQFESGIEMDNDLGNMWLEGGGGGSMEESYQNAIYFFARHTAIDCHEKRQKKGYLFIIGDEKPYSAVSKHQVKAICDDGLQEDIALAEIVKEAQTKFNVFMIIPSHTSYSGNMEVRGVWEKTLGADHVIILENEEAICEAIALAIGLSEDKATIDGAKKDLLGEGVTAATINSVTASLSKLAGDKKASTSKTARL